MQQQSNWLANVSLAAAIGACVLMFAGYCAGVVPFVGPIVALVLMPVEWLLAAVGLLTGIVGYRTSAVLDGAGRSSALAGTALCAVFFALQALLALFACFGISVMALMDGL